jgi:hypothetical protein
MPNDDFETRVNAASASWRQGDVFDGARLPIVWLVDPDRVEAPAANGVTRRIDNERFAEVALVTQTCDVVRQIDVRRFVTIAPVVQLDGDVLANARRRRIPRYAALPGLGEDRFCDLDRLTSVEKSLLLDQHKAHGLRNSGDEWTFAESVRRHFTRAALHDDVVRTLRPLTTLFDKRVGKQTDEGARVEEIDELRVDLSGFDEGGVGLLFVISGTALSAPDPSPVDNSIDHTVAELCSLLGQTEDLSLRWALWTALCEQWAQPCTPIGSVTEVNVEVVTLASMTASQYVGTTAVDLDHLS